MGTFTHTITLISASGDRRETIQALVDTGATFSSAPASVLELLGVVVERTVRLQLANGQIQERPLGMVRAELDGVQSTIPCVFGEPGEPPVIGAITLEVFLMSVDPVQRRLLPVVGFRLQLQMP